MNPGGDFLHFFFSFSDLSFQNKILICWPFHIAYREVNAIIIPILQRVRQLVVDSLVFIKQCLMILSPIPDYGGVMVSMSVHSNDQILSPTGIIFVAHRVVLAKFFSCLFLYFPQYGTN